MSSCRAPTFKYTLTIGKKGESIETKLLKKHYKLKWILAVKA